MWTDGKDYESQSELTRLLYSRVNSHTHSPPPQGLLSFADEPRQIVLQGVYEVYETTPTLPWGDRDRVNRLVVIGNHISREQLHQSFLSCLLSEGRQS